MKFLEHKAIQAKKVSAATTTPVMDEVFNHYAATGTLSEVRFMMGYFLKTNPLSALKMTGVALKLMQHGRISLKTRKLSPEGTKQLKAILDKAHSLGGAK